MTDKLIYNFLLVYWFLEEHPHEVGVSRETLLSHFKCSEDLLNEIWAFYGTPDNDIFEMLPSGNWRIKED